MSAILKTFTGQTLTATEHAMMNVAAYPHTCFVSPYPTITKASDSSIMFLNVYGMIGGRLFFVDETFTLNLPSGVTDGVGQVFARVNVLNVDNPFEVEIEFAETSAGLTAASDIDTINKINFAEEYHISSVIVPLVKFTVTSRAIDYPFELAIPAGANALGLIDETNVKPAGMLPVTLFEGDTTGDVELSGFTTGNLYSNFAYLEIFYDGYEGANVQSMRIPDPNTQTFTLSVVEAGGSATSTRIRRAQYSISGRNLVCNAANSGMVTIANSGITHSMGTNVIHVKKVVGWRR